MRLKPTKGRNFLTIYRANILLAFFVISLFAVQDVVSIPKGGKYEPGQKVEIFANIVSPFNNPSETFEYYSLPFCRPPDEELKRTKQTLGMNIEGDRLFSSLYQHNFAVPISNKELCTKTLNAKEIGVFKKAISKNFLFELYADGLPVQGFIGSILNAGKVDEYDNSLAEFYLFTHLHFVFLFNGDRIIHVSVSSESPDTNAHLLTDDESVEVTFTYSSSWAPVDIKFKDRLSLLKPHRTKGDLEVHWLSIVNSIVLVVLLTGFITLILIRILRKDYIRYNTTKDAEKTATSEESEDDPDDYGWKLIYGDVFRFPKHFNYLTAFVGVGGQLLFVSFGILVLSLLGWLYPEQSGSLYTAAIFLFLFGSFIAGFISSYFYKQMEGDKWAWNVVLSLTLFALPVALISIIGDLIARLYHSTSALPISTGFFIFGIWLIIGFPLTLLGGIAGRRSAGPFDAPVRTKTFARQIPPIPFYRQMAVQMVVAGFLPFSAIYIELYYIYATMWGHSSYQLYSILFIVFIILLIVTASITIALTYFQLAAEDHRWWWRSFCSGGSTGFFVFAYSCYYYVYRSNMSGLLQAVKYFTFVTICCYFFFVMLGTIGFYCSLVFVRHIYRTLKID